MITEELNGEFLIKKYGSVRSFYEAHPSSCACKGKGIIPPNPNDGENRVGCPYHRPLNEWWPQLQKDGTTKFIQTVKNGYRIIYK